MTERGRDMDARCAEYVAMLERGHSLVEVAQHYGIQRNAVFEALLVRGLPTSMKDAVRAYWARHDASAGATQAGAEPAAVEG